MQYPYPSEEAVEEARAAVRDPSSFTRQVVPFDPSMFPKNSKPGQGFCSMGGCYYVPLMAFVGYQDCRAFCATHTPDRYLQ